jgi:predicted HicB family RNase H-like nuclease
MKKSDRYLKIVEWSDEDQCYVGRCPGLMLGGVHGDNEADVYKELCEAVEEWIELIENDRLQLPEPTVGKDYSGKFVLRAGRDLHKALSINAMIQGRSLNEHCVQILKEHQAPYPAHTKCPSTSTD